MEHYTSTLELPLGLRKPVVLDHEGGNLTSDSGVLLLCQADARCGVTQAMADAIADGRQQSKVSHSHWDLVRSRVLAIAAGYPDANDLDTLRHDPALKIACGRCPELDPSLASQPTLSRFENSLSRSDLIRMGKSLAEQVIAQLPVATAKVYLDIDATDDRCHGQQEFEGFNSYYGHHCYLPLLVQLTDEEGTQWPVAALLRPGGTHPHAGVRMLLRNVVGMLRARFGKIEITVRADSGFGCRRVLDCLERLKVLYAVGLAQNEVLENLGKPTQAKGLQKWAKRNDDGIAYGSVDYRAGTWKLYRRVVVKVEMISASPNARYVVTNLWRLKSAAVYKLYCGRGEHENRIKELKLDLSSGRTSCHGFLANQGRLLMHLGAYVLWTVVRAAAAGTQWEKAQVETLRLQLLKVAARVVESTRRICIHLCSSYPHRDAWRHVEANLRLPIPAT